MKRELRDAWVKALRSGEYKQVTHTLYSDRGHCCLGVLACVIGDDLERMEARRRETHYGLPLDPGMVRECMLMNDTERQPFPTIATWIETNVPVDDEPVSATTPEPVSEPTP